MPRFLLDTNAAIAVLAGNTQLRAQIREEDVFLSSIVLGELYFGAENSFRTEENLEKVEELARECAVVNCDQKTAQIYAKVRVQLKKERSPHPAK